MHRLLFFLIRFGFIFRFSVFLNPFYIFACVCRLPILYHIFFLFGGYCCYYITVALLLSLLMVSTTVLSMSWVVCKLFFLFQFVFVAVLLFTCAPLLFLLRCWLLVTWWHKQGQVQKHKSNELNKQTCINMFINIIINYT